MERLDTSGAGAGEAGGGRSGDRGAGDPGPGELGPSDSAQGSSSSGSPSASGQGVGGSDDGGRDDGGRTTSARGARVREPDARGPSPAARVALLLLAPLQTNAQSSTTATARPITPKAYRQLAQALGPLDATPSDLLNLARRSELVAAVATAVPALEAARLERLLAREVPLATSLDQWQQRSIWVLHRTDAGYPAGWLERLGEGAPVLVWGCGGFGGRHDEPSACADPLVGSPSALAVVGSRVTDDASLQFAADVGRLCVAAGRGLVSGAAIGVDEGAMVGALEAGASGGEARVVGVVADSLGKSALDRRWRAHLMKGRLVLLSPFDPGLKPRAANLLARNRLIHGLGAASLAVASAKGKGGTWSGVSEQLAAGRGAVYVRAAESPGLDGLCAAGARRWPEGLDADGLRALLEAGPAVAPRAASSGAPDEGDARPAAPDSKPTRQQGLFDS